MERHTDNEAIPGALIVRPEASLIYFNIDHVCDTILTRVRGETNKPGLVVLDLSAAPYVDLQSAHSLAGMADELRTLGVRLQVVEARSGVRDRLNSEGLEERIGRANRFVTSLMHSTNSSGPNRRHQSPMTPLYDHFAATVLSVTSTHVSADASVRRVKEKSMLRQFLFGGSISICNIVIHALIMTAVVRASQAAAAKAATRPNLVLIAVMAATVSVLMVAHTCEIIVWSLAYGLVDAVPDSTDHLYFAFVNYTTLGYGDIVPVERWRLARANDSHEWSSSVRLVDRRYIRGLAKDHDLTFAAGDGDPTR